MSLYLDLGKMYAEDFEKDNIMFMSGLIGIERAQDILCGCYHFLCSVNKLTDLELLPIEGKKIIWETAKEMADGRLKNNDQMIKLCKCLYALEYLLNN